ncbi:putative Tubulin delta chain [Blattamonas nauphoetae]|uniref:Tubulin delta chain n=1 Tax=Blattamonas nauphoetae TaxID=2049346 RepID=A0ABQ9X8I6_9EUKA|nr:putative Tubulin delta chain [Blattamonas nauphoetae]
MSLLTVQLGQYGNQMGYDFFDILSQELDLYQGDAYHTFFTEKERGSHVARCVLVDMEEKVVNRALELASKTNKWSYNNENVFVRESGAGNNWAFGYARLSVLMQDPVLELVRKEAEASNNLEGFLLFHSLAGGTGSGVGTHLSEILHDEFPSKILINQVAWPFISGDVVVQHFNGMLTLAHLNQVSDGIIFSENEVLQSISQQELKIDQPSFFDMNKIVAENVCGLFLPSRSIDIRQTRDQNVFNKLDQKSLNTAVSRLQSSPSQIINHLCCHSGFKLLSFKSFPHVPPRSRSFEDIPWKTIVPKLSGMVGSNAKTEQQSRNVSEHIRPQSVSLSNVVSLRGMQHVPTDFEALQRDLNVFSRSLFNASWALNPVLLRHSPLPFRKVPMSGVVCSNSQACLPPLQNLIATATQMQSAGAHLNHYAEYGIGKDHFTDCLEEVQQINENYSSLSYT